MTERSRRSVLQLGSALASSAFGATVIGTTGRTSARPSASEQFILDTSSVSSRVVDSAAVDVVSRLDAIDTTVVRGREADVERIGAPFETDPVLGGSNASTSTPVVTSAADSDGASAGQRQEGVLQRYAEQWDRQSQQIPQVHQLTRGGGTRVAVIDTGIYAGHPDLLGRVDESNSRAFTNDGYGPGPFGGPPPYSHGTEVASVIAATGQGLLGVAPEAELIDCRVFPPGGGVRTSDYLDAIVYSVQLGCDVANLSLGPTLAATERYRILERFETRPIAAYAEENGMLLTVAAGNSSVDLTRFPLIGFLNSPNVMIVSATGPLGFGWADEQRPVTEPAPYSNYGGEVINVSAPGGNFDSTARANQVPGHQYDLLPVNQVQHGAPLPTGEVPVVPIQGHTMGTSHAAPQVAATAALVRSLDPSLSPSNVRERIERTAHAMSETDPDPFHGAGHLDPLGALTGE